VPPDQLLGLATVIDVVSRGVVGYALAIVPPDKSQGAGF